MKRRIRRRLTELLLHAVTGLLDRTLGPAEKKKRKKHKNRSDAGDGFVEIAPAVSGDGTA